MTEDCGVAQTFAVRLSDIEGRDRDAVLREEFGRGWLNVEFEPLARAPEIEARFDLLPGVAVSRGRYTPHGCSTCVDPSLADDDVALCWIETNGRFLFQHLTIDDELTTGTAVLTSCADVMTGTCDGVATPTTIKISRGRLLPLLRDGEGTLGRRLAPDNVFLWMLRQYLPIATASQVMSNNDAARMAGEHITELVALALGASDEGLDCAKENGLREARFVVITGWVERRLADPTLSIDMVCARFGVGRRTLQAVFADHDTSFTSYLRDKRLALAYSQLSNPLQDHRSISQIAYDVGFGDLSYFNRCFRQRFGMTPGDVRKGMRASRH